MNYIYRKIYLYKYIILFIRAFGRAFRLNLLNNYGQINTIYNHCNAPIYCYLLPHFIKRISLQSLMLFEFSFTFFLCFSVGRVMGRNFRPGSTRGPYATAGGATGKMRIPGGAGSACVMASSLQAQRPCGGCYLALDGEQPTNSRWWLVVSR